MEVGPCLGDLLGLYPNWATPAVKRDFTPGQVSHLLKSGTAQHAVGVTRQLPLKSLSMHSFLWLLCKAAEGSELKTRSDIFILETKLLQL